MKDTDPLPYKPKSIHNKVEVVDNETVEVYKLISESVNDMVKRLLNKLKIRK